jgi:hypothetical protein
MKRGLILGAIAGAATLVGWQALPAIQNATEPANESAPAPNPKPVATPKLAEATPKPAALPPVSKATPMAERVATVGLLNKRNGLWRDFEMKPGDAKRVGDVVIRLKACEKTEPWEQDKLTGAFVQVIVRESNAKWYKVFSGWLFKESPSLNVVEHPVYDVWAKDCKMRFPETGPDTTVVRGGGDADSPGNGKSKARKSPSRDSSADDSNDT